MEFIVNKCGVPTVTLIDKEIFIKISNRKWFINNRNYVSARIKGKYTLLHRFILNLNHGEKIFVDHINLNRLDNRMSNLRLCTFADNLKNKVVYKNNKSGLKGVNKRIKLDGSFSYRARIKKDGVLIQLGTYKNPNDAAIAYDKKAAELFGEFANLNFKSKDQIQ